MRLITSEFGCELTDVLNYEILWLREFTWEVIKDDLLTVQFESHLTTEHILKTFQWMPHGEAHMWELIRE